MMPCSASTAAVNNPSPEGTVSEAASVFTSAPRPPYAKQAAMSAAKASVFSRLVNSCERLPQRTPRHCKSAKATVTPEATATLRPASEGTSSPAYSPTTSATAATVPHVESQSLQPTTKAGYSPSARRAKT